MKAKLEEVIYFSTAEDLLTQLNELDPAFRRAAFIVDSEWMDDVTFAGGSVRHWRLTLEAELDASPEA